MHTAFKNLLKQLGIYSLGMLILFAAGARAADDKQALTGLKEVKVAFDIKEGDAKLLQARLDIIDETRKSLIQQGVTPHFILAFRGPSSKLVQTDQSKIKPEDRVLAEKIAVRIKEMMNAPGIVGIEQCAVAARQQETNTDLVLPGIRIVGNSFISLMAYQTKGYTYINP